MFLLREIRKLIFNYIHSTGACLFQYFICFCSVIRNPLRFCMPFFFLLSYAFVYTPMWAENREESSLKNISSMIKVKETMYEVNSPYCLNFHIYYSPLC